MAKKKMYKKGSFLEPNKELTFGRMKKGKYQAAGARPESKADPKKAPDYRPTTSNRAGTGRPLNSGTKGTPVRSSGTPAGPPMSAKVAAENALKSLPGARERKQNTPQGTGGGAKPYVGSKLRELSNAPGPKPAPKAGTYAAAKKRNPNLDKLIKQRKGLKKGTEEYNRVQNQINRAYGKGPVNRKEISKVAAAKTPKNTAKPTLKVKTSAETAAKPDAKTPPSTPAPRSKVSPSGGSGMGAMRSMDNLKEELKSASPGAKKPVDRRGKRSARKSDRLKKRVSRLQGKM